MFSHLILIVDNKVSVLQQEPHDNVFVDVLPGEEYIYQYEIEADHPAGTYWYHAHLHGATMFQVSLLQCFIYCAGRILKI